MWRSTVLNAVSDLGMTYEHTVGMFSSDHRMNHGQHCVWCALKRKEGNKRKGRALKYTLYSHPSGTDLKASGSTPVKRALFIGINYYNTRNELKGCVNDAVNMHRLMQHEFHFNDCKLLTDDNKYNVKALPTKTNIIKHIQWLTANTHAGDMLFFHYSGHGSQIRDTTQDEQDGMDEVLVPADYQQSGYITDDDLFRILVEAVPRGVTLVAVIDACHSGTMLDLPHMYISKDNVMLQRSQPKFTKGNIVCISASRDQQTAADITTASKSYGALTHALIATIKQRQLRANLPTLLHGVTEKLRALPQTPCVSTSNNITLDSFYVGVTRST